MYPVYCPFVTCPVSFMARDWDLLVWLQRECRMNSVIHMHHTAASPLSRQGWLSVEYLSEWFSTGSGGSCVTPLCQAKEVLTNDSGAA